MSIVFCTSELQFGFKKQVGCTSAIFALRQCVQYFIECGSTVFMTALDAKEAFDRVNHVKLLHRLCDVVVPVQCTLSSDDYELVQQDIYCCEMMQLVFSAISC